MLTTSIYTPTIALLLRQLAETKGGIPEAIKFLADSEAPISQPTFYRLTSECVIPKNVPSAIKSLVLLGATAEEISNALAGSIFCSGKNFKSEWLRDNFDKALIEGHESFVASLEVALDLSDTTEALHCAVRSCFAMYVESPVVRLFLQRQWDCQPATERQIMKHNETAQRTFTAIVDRRLREGYKGHITTVDGSIVWSSLQRLVQGEISLSVFPLVDPTVAVATVACDFNPLSPGISIRSSRETEALVLVDQAAQGIAPSVTIKTRGKATERTVFLSQAVHDISLAVESIAASGH